jgi:predicted membrane-bound spermidine synthase/Flp pilus assembly protein TadD
MPSSLWLHAVFLCSGISGLIYQVVWVRQFGQIFGNTVYSASIVVAIFMVGLGAGSYCLGALADRPAFASRLRRGSREPGDANDLVWLYALLEVLIGVLGIVVSLALPHLAAIVARLSSYNTGPDGWQALSAGSYVWRGLLAVLLLGPITVLMGGTLTVLVRARVRADLDASGWRVASLYGANTIGAAAGAFLTDFVLAPAVGLLATQLTAAGLNFVAAAGAFRLSVRSRDVAVAAPPHADRASAIDTSVPWASLALALSGFAALGLEILWLRHLGVLLGGFRAVLSLLLTVMLLALGTGALVGGWLDRRLGRPARTLMTVQGVFAAATLIGLASNTADGLAAHGAAIAASLGTLSSSSRAIAELWFNLRPMLFEVALPSFVGGMAFPLANAIVQRARESVGRRAGVLYAANTAGAVVGSLVTGYLLLPRFGMQRAAAILAGVAIAAIVPLYMASGDRPARRPAWALAGGGIVGVGALVLWLMQPGDFIVSRALAHGDASERTLTLREGITELVAVVERAGRGRGLLTNGHAMSSTAPLDQRYMRALAHIPLLSMNRPERVLVIGFGVGNTTHAAALHSSVTRVEVADLSRNILEHAEYFRESNGDVLRSAKVSVFVNDGRQHLQMAGPATYDLITLEPPPIAHAGVAALYSREFYALARSRLTPGGYISQWLPAYQVPAESSLAMVRAFLDIFPQSVLLSGAQAELLLVGTTAPHIELDPVHVAATLAREPAVREDLARVDLGTIREIAGAFVGSAETLARATVESPAVTDDRPLQEYGVRSGLSAGLMGVPSSLFDVMQVGAWCRRCVEDEANAEVADLDLYLRLLQQAYLAPVADVASAAAARPSTALSAAGRRRLLNSAYLGAIVPDTAEVHNLLGLAHLRGGRVDEAISEFQSALAKDLSSAHARANLGQIRYEQGAALMESRRFNDAVPLLRLAVDLLPESAEAHNDLGVTLASMGRVDEALGHFERAVSLKPDFAEAHANLLAARQASAPARAASGRRTSSGSH